jgi:hypothetical protein
LEVIRGMALQIWHELRTTGNTTPEAVFNEWEQRAIEFLTPHY